MKKQTNRLLSILLTLVMLLGMMPMTVFAADSHTHDYTANYQYADNKTHYGVCSCGEVDSSNPIGCTYNDGVPAWDKAPSEDSEGKRTWECTLCNGEWQETIPAHICSAGDIWIQDDNTYHSTTCTFSGCGAWMGQRHSEYMTGIFHEDADTVRNECTKCEYYTSYNIEATLTTIEAKAATCAAPGNLKFYICSHCDKYFSDENCQHEITPAEVYINPLEHNYVNGTCSECGYEIREARFAQSLDDTFSSEDRYLYVLIGVGSDGKLYAMGEATADGKRYGVEIPNAQIDENGVVTLTPQQAEFMNFEYYFENGSGASTTSTFMVDGNYMTVRNGKIYTFPKDRLDDKENPRPFDFRQADYGDESGLGYVYGDLYEPENGHKHTFEYITFNPETHYFEACDTQQNTIYLYRQICDHDDIDVTHSVSVAPTCTEQGYNGNYWYCSKCYKYFSDEACITELVLPDYVNLDEYFNAPALGHKFAANGVCENCGMKRNVYKPITSLEQFDQLSGDAYYIIVFKDGDKTYAARVPETTYPCDADANGNGILDIAETDDNANGFPDSIENYIDSYWGGADSDENGVTTIEEYKEALGDYDGDDDIDNDDCLLFVEQQIHWELHMSYEEIAVQVPNFVEVTIAADGSITIVDEGAVEFQMIEGGVWGSQPPLEDSLEYDYEYFGILDTERIRAAWIPNYWFGATGMMGYYDESHFMLQGRYYGDREYPGILDHKNWKISFNDDGTACLVNTWEEFDNTGALYLAKYTDGDGNEQMTIVGLPEWLWGDSEIMLNRTALIPAYLYASEPVYEQPPHECIWGPWEDDDVTDTHTRKCTVEGCDKKQTEDHNWDNGVQTETPTCTEPGTTTYTCPDCKATKTEPIPALDHDWGEWTYDSVDSHIRHCKRDNCDAEDFGGHEWGNWVSVDENTHKMTCSVCGGYQTGDHDWDNGVVTKEPTESEAGIKTYTCGTCTHTKTEPIDKLVHECIWSDWYPNGDENHKRDCLDDNCDKFETEDHEWDSGVITKDPTCKETGIKTFTCQVCYHTRTEDIPTVDHEFGDWTPNNDGATHSRFCSCNESETADHKFDDGEVTQAPTHEAVGEKTYACADCGYSYTEDIPALTEHEWGEWVVNKLDEANTHIRFCICNESETAPHNFDDGKVTTEATHTSKGVKTFTCSDCGYSYTEEIPETPGHEWSDWVGSNDGRTHIHECKCGETEAMAHNWSTWIEQAAGGYKRICADCGAYETMTLDDEKPVNTTTNDNAANTNLTNTDIELIDKVLTDEEQSQIAEGAEVRIYLKVEDISNEAPTEHREKVEANAGDDEIGMYLDIDLFKQVGNATETLVTETAGAVSITITIPDNLINTDASVIRIYKIIRVHEGEDGSVVTDVIEGVFNPEDNSFTFETDKFSTYALAYNDQPIAVYTVTYTDGVDGVEIFATQTFTVDAGAATPAFVGTPTRRGYIFSGWTPSVEATVTDNVIYTAVWDAFEPIPMFYTITTANPSNGEIFLSPPVAHKGITVMITVVPNDGYILETLVVTDRNGNEIELIDKGNGKYTFEMPESKVHVNAFFVEENVVRNPFEDVCSDAYYYDAVLWAVKHSITEGTSENTFSPDDPCTRAQMVTFLWRAAGSPEPKTTECQFTDVDMDSYYGKAVLWAVEQGITNGTSDTTFSPDVTCTRAQMVTLLCRMVDGKAVSSTNAFDDVKADEYYAESVQWAIENGITDGTGDNKFSPDATCTRAQLVTFLYRYFAK